MPRGHVRLAVFDGENADPLNGRPLGDGLCAYTPWGELAYALAGRQGYALVQRSDVEGGAPGADTLKELFGGEPTLILLAELSVYLRKLRARDRERAGGQLTAFLTALFKAVESSPNAAVVYTLAIGKDGLATDAYSEENQFIADKMEEAESVPARKVDKSVHITGGYETAEGGTLEIMFTGPVADAQPVKDFLDPQLRAAREKDVSVTFTLTFSEGLPLAGDAPEKLTERLSRFGTGAAYISATTEGGA